MMAYQLDESQVTYRVLSGFITRVNGAYNDGGTTYKFILYHCRIVENTRSYEVRNGGSIPSSDTSYGNVAPMVEQRTENSCVTGSSPVVATN